MKLFYTVFLITLSTQASADIATFSSSDQILSVPVLSINGSLYYENVEISLNPSTGKFSIMSATPVSAAELGTQNVSVSFEAPGTLFTNDTLTLLDIQDSRCPNGAQCVVAGQVIIGMQLRDQKTNGITLMEMRLEGNGSLPAEEVKTEKYTFRLTEATPYPDLDVELDDNDYQFKVEYSLNSG